MYIHVRVKSPDIWVLVIYLHYPIFCETVSAIQLNEFFIAISGILLTNIFDNELLFLLFSGFKLSTVH